MKEVTEALKEGARVAVLAVIPVLIDSLGRGEVNWTLVLVTGATALLRFLDSYLHKSGIAQKGITRF